MIKRDVTETVYEYDKEGKLVKKTVTETHEEDDNTTMTWPYTTPYWHWPQITCNTAETNKIPEIQKSLNDYLSTDHTYATSTTTAHNNWKYSSTETTKCDCAHD